LTAWYQYVLLICGKGCWGDLESRMNNDINKETTSPAVQIPALEWNNILKPNE